MLRRRPALRGDQLWREAFGELDGLADAIAVLDEHFSNETAIAYRSSLRLDDPRTARSAASALRREEMAALGSAPAIAAWAVLMGPLAGNDYDGYGVRDALHCVRDLRTLARGRRDSADSALQEAFGAVLALRALLLLAIDDNPAVRVSALRALHRVRPDPRVAEVAVGAASDPHPDVRAAAASLLAHVDED